MPGPQVHAIGVAITVTIKDQDQNAVDLTSMTALTIYLRRPTGRVSAHPAAIVGPPTDGTMQYVTVNIFDFDIPGEWTIQARVGQGTTIDYFTDAHVFRVADNIAP